MIRYRSILALCLTLITVLLLTLSHPGMAQAATTYTPAQLEKVQTYRDKVQTVRDRMPKLATLIENRRWTDVRSIIHGPFGQLREDMLRAARALAPADQKAVTEAAKGIFGHLVEIDEAAENTDYRQAIRNYAEAIKDFNTFFDALPQG